MRNKQQKLHNACYVQNMKRQISMIWKNLIGTDGRGDVEENNDSLVQPIEVDSRDVWVLRFKWTHSTTSTQPKSRLPQKTHEPNFLIRLSLCLQCQPMPSFLINVLAPICFQHSIISTQVAKFKIWYSPWQRYDIHVFSAIQLTKKMSSSLSSLMLTFLVLPSLRFLTWPQFNVTMLS